ncbi:hypothetical protein F511_43044 [Dorcoceras hygrometricum]|uniref:Uncharacterized protein n=1 Tax=Dorcoceras hygrometricum TaxID=472368 RepID=A0A2Z6ZZ59_9LAMI|nr:hypothetical protein F511_43044 [Dorcoceras hygrometricum]
MAMQLNFEYVFAMEHTGMVTMFKYLEEKGLMGFLEVFDPVFEGAVTEFFTNTKVKAGTIVSFVANQKMIITKDVFAKNFGLPSEDIVVEARIQAAPTTSMFGTSSDADSCPLAKLVSAKRGQATPKRKQVVESWELESTVSIPPVLITKKQRTKRTKKVKPIAGNKGESQPDSVHEIPAEAEDIPNTTAPESNMEKTPRMEGQADNASTAADQEEQC